MTERVTWDDVAASLLHPESDLVAAWGNRPVYLKSAGADSLFDGFDATLVTELLGPPFVTMFYDQRPIEITRYTRDVAGVTLLPPARLLDRRKLLDELAKGASVKLNRMQVWNARSRDAARGLAEHFGHHVEAWGFYSNDGQAMLPWHRDPTDNICIQVSGEKRWYLGNAMPTTNTAENFHRLTGDVEEICVGPGDVLYIPFGWSHQAKAETKTSYHVSFAIKTPSVDSVRRAVLSAMAKDWLPDGMLPMREPDLPALVGLFPPTMSEEIRRVWNGLEPAEQRKIFEG